MAVIHKILLTDPEYIQADGLIKAQLPKDAVPLSVHTQNSRFGVGVALWYRTENFQELMEVTFAFIPTGSAFVEDDLNYIGTVEYNELVWHIHLVKAKIPE